MKLKLPLLLSIMILLFSCETNEQKTSIPQKENTSIATKENSSESGKKQTLDDKIKTIKSNISVIESQLSSFENKVVLEDIDGGFIEKEGYFESNVPKKVKLINMSEHSTLIRTFYLQDNALFFVFEEEYSEASVQVPHTEKEKRYYIHNDKLIRVLEKEKTAKSIDIDMTKVQNVDVTNQWQSKQYMLKDFKKILRETSTFLLEMEVVGLDNGRWISIDDPDLGVEIKDGLFIILHKGIETGPEIIFDYELYEEQGIEYLRLKNDYEEIVYGLLEYSEEIMVLDHLGRGKIVTYRKEN
ncbi:MAG: hypothetical protein AAF611_11820 [Bacteroidota bacterium]